MARFVTCIGCASRRSCDKLAAVKRLEVFAVRSGVEIASLEIACSDRVSDAHPAHILFAEYPLSSGYEIAAALEMQVDNVRDIIGFQETRARDWQIMRDRGNIKINQDNVKIMRSRLEDRQNKECAA